MVAVPTRGYLLMALVLASALAIAGCSTTGDTPEPAGADASKPPPSRTAPYAVTQLELPYRAVNKPQRVGESIYAVVTLGEDGEGAAAIVRYDTGTGQVARVVTAPQPIGWFAVNDKWLVWTVERDLYARPLAGGKRTRLAHGRDLYAPALSGDLVAWDGLTKDRTHEIVVHDLGSGRSEAVGDVKLADLYNNFPAWEREKLVWTDTVSGEGRYRVYNAKSRTTEEYPLADGAFRYPGYAQIEGDRLYSINFDNVTEWNWSRQRLGYYSMTDRRFVPVVPEGFIANAFEVANGLLAVIDDKQQLTIAPTDAAEYDAAKSSPVDGPVDFIEESSDGTLIAWRESPDDRGSCTLFVIERR